MGRDKPPGVHPAVGDFTWHRLGNPKLTPGQIADKGRRSIRSLQAWDVPVPAGCRLRRATSLIERYAFDPEGVRQASDEERHRLGEAARSLLELYTATHATKRRPPDEVLTKFAQAILGADLPEEEPAHAARDTQFELYLWGVLQATGAPCWFAEPPDLICEYGEQRIGVAAKRIWSAEQAKKRLSLGAEQIERTGLRGFIAVNAQEYLSADSGVEDLAQKGVSFNQDVHRLHGHLTYLATKPHVLGMIVAGTVYTWEVPTAGKEIFNVSSYHQLLVLTDDPDEEERANRFSDERRSGLARWFQHNL